MSTQPSTRGDAREHYSAAQIALHWLVVLLVAVQYLSHDGMEHFWDAAEHGANESLTGDSTAFIHAISGLAIFALVLLRITLRLWLGAPPAPQDLHPLLRLAAKLSHFALYALLLILPLTGAAAIFGGREGGAQLHGLLVPVLWALIVLHILAAIYHAVVRGDGVFQRMTKPG